MFLCHAAIYSGYDGWLARTAGFGVDLFFTLSALLISELLLREETRRGRINVRSFWIRRILRIWPLYFSFLAVALALSPAFRIPLYQLVACVLFVGNFAFVFSAKVSSLIGSLWSVPIEEQFYLTWPLLAQRLTRSGVGRFALGLWLFSAISRALVVHFNGRPLLIDWGTMCRLDPIAAGLLLSATGIRAWRGIRLAVAGTSLCLILVAGLWHFAFQMAAANVLCWPLVAIGCAGLLVASMGAGSWMHKAWLIYLGRISYGLYVFHLPGLMAARIVAPGFTIPLGSVFTVATAAISYQYLESPFLRLKKRFQYVPSQP